MNYDETNFDNANDPILDGGGASTSVPDVPGRQPNGVDPYAGWSEKAKSIATSEAYRDPRHPRHQQAVEALSAQLSATLPPSKSEDDISGYDYSTMPVPAGVADEHRQGYVAMARNANLPPSIASDLIAENERTLSSLPAAERDRVYSAEEGRAVLGADADIKIDAAKRFLSRYPGLQQFLATHIAGNNPRVIAALAAREEAGGEEASAIDALIRSEAYQRSSHPDHQRVFAKVRAHFAKLYS
jgi:hypothetical protein